MRGQTLLITWIISVMAIYLVGALILGAIADYMGGSGTDIISSSYPNPEYIMWSIGLATVFTPFCYCYQKVNE